MSLLPSLKPLLLTHTSTSTQGRHRLPRSLLISAYTYMNFHARVDLSFFSHYSEKKRSDRILERPKGLSFGDGPRALTEVDAAMEPRLQDSNHVAGIRCRAAEGYVDIIRIFVDSILGYSVSVNTRHMLRPVRL
jgi:hypothetical protein